MSKRFLLRFKNLFSSMSHVSSQRKCFSGRDPLLSVLQRCPFGMRRSGCVCSWQSTRIPSAWNRADFLLAERGRYDDQTAVTPAFTRPPGSLAAALLPCDTCLQTLKELLCVFDAASDTAASVQQHKPTCWVKITRKTAGAVRIYTLAFVEANIRERSLFLYPKHTLQQR